MLHKGVYKDAFVLHDESEEDPYEKEELERVTAETGVLLSYRRLTLG